MRSVSRGHKVLVLVMIVAISMVGLPVFASPASANLAGTILRTGDGAPVEGAVVKVAIDPDAAGSKIYESRKTNEKGNYSLSGLPAGSYKVAVEADGGLYVVDSPVALVSGEKRTLSLSVRPSAGKGQSADEPTPTPAPAPEPTPPATPPATPPETPPATPTEPPPATGAAEGTTPPPPPEKKSFFRTAWGGAVIVVGTALVVGALANSSDNNDSANASPSK